jgi:hypothetical protein
MNHFQTKKQKYRRFVAQAHPLDATMLAATDAGIVYFKLRATSDQESTSGLANDGSSVSSTCTDCVSDPHRQQSHLVEIPSFGESIRKASLQGRLSPYDLYQEDRSRNTYGVHAISLPNRTKRAVFNRLVGAHFLRELEIRKENKSKESSGARQLVASELRTDYCVVFKSDLSNCDCELIGSELSLVQLAAGASSVVSQSVDPVRGVYEHGLTVISVGWAGEVASSTAPLVYASLESGVGAGAGAGVGVGLVLDMVSVLV